ncbi:MAG TPA: hypothetical protein VJT31_28085 [Rugosimonospora sp.]|nr:hypothetical protein [Rugosimonospora sp.]
MPRDNPQPAAPAERCPVGDDHGCDRCGTAVVSYAGGEQRCPEPGCCGALRPAAELAELP